MNKISSKFGFGYDYENNGRYKKTIRLLRNISNRKYCERNDCQQLCKQFRKCSKCQENKKSIFYCSRKCQKMDWMDGHARYHHGKKV